MASVTSLSNSSYNTSSIYGNRNVLSGLASGMDTETMIENAVSGIKMKIQNLIKKRTKVEWQQEAYRSIIDKAVNFNRKYTSYSSKTNLLSQSFFSNAVNTTTNGTYKDKITASGKTSSDIKINAVKQLATAATYTVGGLAGMQPGQIVADTVNLSDPANVSTISGTLSIKYGGTNGTAFDLDFGELENIEDIKEVYDADGNKVENPSSAQKLAQAINDKLSEITYNYTDHGFAESKKGDQVIKAVANEDGSISFEDLLKTGNKVSVGSVTGDIGKTLGIEAGDTTIGPITYDTELVDKGKTKAEYLEGKELTFSLNGVGKKVTLGKYETAQEAMDDIQKQLDDAYGKGKVIVGNPAKDGKLSLTFDVKEQGSTLGITGKGLEALGLQEDGAYNYVNTGKKLGDLLGKEKAGDIFSNKNLLLATGEVKASGDKMVDEKGNTVQMLKNDKGEAIDQDGKVLGEDDEKVYYRVDKEGKALYEFKMNDASIAVNEDTTLESLINSVNSNPDAGVKISYSKMTNEFKITASETGANSGIKMDGVAKGLFGDPATADKKLERTSALSDVLGPDYDTSKYGNGKFTVEVGGEKLSVDAHNTSNIATMVKRFNDQIASSVGSGNEKLEGVTADFDYNTNSFVFKKGEKEMDVKYGEGVAQDFAKAAKKSYVEGQDAIMDVEVNGKRFENLTRSNNSFDIDGMTINVKGTFNVDGSNSPDKDGNEYEPITFTTSTDTDKLVDTIRDFVNDYNEMITEIKNAYSTQPLTKSDNSRYDPLTAEQEEQYSESELKAYNEKAKTGILFGDSDLSRMYGKMLNAIQPGGADGQTLREIGIGTSYSNGLTTIELDESKLRAALESDPDKVRNAFTKTKEGGADSDGLMQTMQNTLNTYVKDTGEPKGVLITRAGSAKAPTSLNSNSLKSQIDSYDNQIDRWQNKMADQIDRYTTQFSRLEQLIAEMNSQASAMSGLMGGGTGY